MKILVCIPNFDLVNINFFNRVMEEYCKMDFDITLSVDSTVQLDYSKYKKIAIYQTLHNYTIGPKLVFEHREKMACNKEEFDLFIYSENDILITQKNIESFISITQKLSPDNIVGFMRYEKKNGDDNKYLIDAHPTSPTVKDKNIVINNIRYFTMENLHQGCFILTREQLNRAIKSGGFLVGAHYKKMEKQGYSFLESGGSDVFTQCGFNWKLLPKENLENFLIHHLPDKYVNDFGPWKGKLPLSLEAIKKFVA